jgi:hypothetical protein
MPKRIAFVVSAIASGELTAGAADASHVYSRLVDQQLGCCDHSSKILPSCRAFPEFRDILSEMLSGWTPDDQLIFYFSGHGGEFNNRYCLKFGNAKTDWYPFSNLITDLEMWRVQRAIVMLDACFSGQAIKSDDLGTILDILPSGFAYLVSSGDRQVSREVADGSVSVFTDLLRAALDTGLGGKPTSDGMICVDDLAIFMRDRLQNDDSYRDYSQRPLWDVHKADERIWVAKNKSGGSFEPRRIASHEGAVYSDAELRILFESTAKDRLPVSKATSLDLDEELVHDIYKHRNESEKANAEIPELADDIGLFADIPVGNKTFLHRAAIICFCRNPEKFIPQATSTLVIGEPGSEGFQRVVFRGPLATQFRTIYVSTMKNLARISRVGSDGLRQEVEEISPDLVREVLSNAFVHRNYESAGGIEVRLTPDWLDIKSPGELRYSWSALLEQKVPVSIPVDPAVVLYAQDHQVCEKIGRGFEVIRKYVDENGAGSVTCTCLEGPTTLVRIRRWQQRQRSAGPIFYNIPSLPPAYCVREGALEQARSNLLRAVPGVGSEATARPTALSGMGGIGKTVLATALVHDSAVRASFPDGIVWLSLGSGAPTLAKAAELARAAGGIVKTFTDVGEARGQLGILTANMRLLIVLDDVWEPEVVDPFSSMGADCRLLITTRMGHVIERARANRQDIDVLEHNEARVFLATLTGENIDELPAEADDIIRLCGGLPLAIAALGAMIRRGRYTWTDALAVLKDRALEELDTPWLDDPTLRSVKSVLKLSIDTLGETERNWFFDCVTALGEDVTISEAALFRLWAQNGASQRRSLQVADALTSHGLMYRDEERRYHIHELLKDYVRSLSPSEHIAMEDEDTMGGSASDGPAAGH